MTYLKCITILCLFFFCLYIVNTERILVLCRVSFFGPGPATDGIQVQRTRYNEFVESGSKSWALMRRRLVWERTMIKQELRTQNQTALHPREKGLLVRGCELPAPLASHEPFFFFLFSFFFGRSLLLYILFLRSSSSYTCQSSMPILECTSHRLLFLVLCEPLWPQSLCPGVTSTSMGSGCQLQVFNMEMTASSGVAFLSCSYGWLIGFGISFGILKGTASSDVTPSPSVILVCREMVRPRQYILAVWIPFIRPRTLLPPWCAPWA